MENIKEKEILTLRDVPEETKKKAIEEAREAPITGEMTDKKINHLDLLYDYDTYPLVNYEKLNQYGQFEPKSTFEVTDRSRNLFEAIQGNVSVVTGAPQRVTVDTVKDRAVFFQDDDGKRLGFKKVGERELAERRQIGGRTTEDLFAGPVKLVIDAGIDPVTKVDRKLPIYVKIPPMTKNEFNKYIDEFYQGYEDRRNMNVPELLPISTADDPVPIVQNGRNIKYGRTTSNRVVGYPESMENLFLKKGLQRTAGAIYDVVYKPIAIDALPFMMEKMLPLALNTVTGNKYTEAMKKTSAALIGIVNSPLAIAMYSKENGIQDLTSLGYGSKTSAELLSLSLKRPDLVELYKGVSTWSEEDIAFFIEGKDEAFINKIVFDLYAGKIFTRFIREAVTPAFGGGLQGAQKFLNVINGLEKSDLDFKTGYQFWKASKTDKYLKGKSEDTLKKEWTGLLKSKQTQYTNLAFMSYAKAKFKKDGLFNMSGIKRNFYKDRLAYAINPSKVIKDEDMAERFVSLSGVVGQEVFGDSAYLPVALFGTVGLGKLYNSNFYKGVTKGDNRLIGTLGVPFEFGRGFKNGIDYIAFRASGVDRVSQEVFNDEFIKLKTANPNLSDTEIETELRFTKGIINPASQMENSPIEIIDSAGKPRIIQPGSREYKKLEQLADDIKGMEPEQRAYILNGIKDFRKKVLSIYELGKKVGGDKNPAMDLHVNFGEILNLMTTRLGFENLIEKADYGMFKSLKLGHAENTFQMRVKSVEAMSKIVSNVLPLLNRGDVSQETRNLILGLKQYLDGENQFVNQSVEFLNSAKNVYAAALSENIFFSDRNLSEAFKEEKELINFELLGKMSQINKIANEINTPADRLKEQFQNNKIKMNSIMDNYLNGTPEIHSRSVSSRVNDSIINDINIDKKSYATELFSTVHKGLKGKQVEGQNVDQFFDGVMDILYDKVPYERLPATDRNEITAMFNFSLQPKYQQLKSKLDESNIQLEGIDLDDTNGIELYRYYRNNKDNLSGKDRALFDRYFGTLDLQASDLIEVSQVISNKVYRLSEVMKSGESTKIQQNTLNKLMEYNKTIDKMMFDTSPDVFGEYQKAKKLYNSYVASSLYGKFNRMFEGGKIRTDVAPEGKGKKEIYKDARVEVMTAVGEHILDNPEDAAEIMLSKFGEPIRLPTYQDGDAPVYGIVTSTQKERADVYITNAINAAIIKRTRNDIFGITGIKDEDINLQNLKDKQDKVTEAFNKFSQDGEFMRAIKVFENKFNNNVQGVQAWSREYGEDGKMIFKEDTPFTQDQDGNVTSVLSDNTGPNKKVYKYEEARERLYGSSLSSVIKNNDDLKKAVQKYKGNINYVNDKISANFRTIEKDIVEKRNLLVKVFADAGFYKEGVFTANANPTSLAKFFMESGNTNTIKEFKNVVLQNLKVRESLSQRVVGKGGRGRTEIIKVNPEQELDRIINTIVLNQFAEDVSTIISQKRIIPDSLEKGKSVFVNRTIPDAGKVQEAVNNYGNIIQEVMGQDQFGKFMDLVEILNYGKIGPQSFVYKNLADKGMTNIPAPYALTSIFARVFSMAREVVGTRYVAAEAGIRNMRLLEADAWRMILSSNVARSGDKTLLDVVHDMAVKNEITDDNVNRFLKLLPEAMYQSQIDFIDFRNDNGERDIKFKMEVTPRYEQNEERGQDPQLRAIEDELDLLGIPKRGRVKREQPTRR